LKRFASLRYDGVLAPREREKMARSLASAGVAVTSWNAAAGRTYARVALAGSPTSAAELPGRIDEPPLTVLRLIPDTPPDLARVRDALGGPGRPLGVVDARLDDGTLVVELDTSLTPLALLVAVVDVALGGAARRRIEPLLPLDDATLTAFAGALLGEPELDSSRLIETHLEPLIGALG
jgi:hypothetical protein